MHNNDTIDLYPPCGYSRPFGKCKSHHMSVKDITVDESYKFPYMLSREFAYNSYRYIEHRNAPFGVRRKSQDSTPPRVRSGNWPTEEHLEYTHK